MKPKYKVWHWGLVLVALVVSFLLMALYGSLYGLFLVELGFAAITYRMAKAEEKHLQKQWAEQYGKW
jgi:hypothetical protein